jgi:hypothetical protein
MPGWRTTRWLYPANELSCRLGHFAHKLAAGHVQLSQGPKQARAAEIADAERSAEDSIHVALLYRLHRPEDPYRRTSELIVLPFGADL